MKRNMGRGGSGYVQHVELAKVSVNEPSILEHLPHVLHHLQVELAGLGLRQRGVLQQGGGPKEATKGPVSTRSSKPIILIRRLTASYMLSFPMKPISKTWLLSSRGSGLGIPAVCSLGHTQFQTVRVNTKSASHQVLLRVLT